MERVTGIGGLFFRATDPGALARWYRDVLGVATYSEEDGQVWWPEAGATVVSPFPADTEYFGRPDQAWMVNFRVDDLEAMLAQVGAHGGTVVDERQELDGIGRFGWVVDPEGNRIELWQPAPEARQRP